MSSPPAGTLPHYLGSHTGPADLQAGALLAGRYRLVASLGAGGMGKVWQAADERLRNRPCAVKQVPLAGASPEERAWFEREAATLADLTHPSICDIKDWFEEQGNGYLVLELIHGHTLAEEVASRGTPGLPEAQVLEWAREIGDALAYLHQQTPVLVFRDLKPQNIMLRPDGHIALIDFGIARPAIVTGGTTIGTPGYAPPEQYQGIAEPRSDQYALAATLHHLLTGRNPETQPPFQFPPARSLLPSLSVSVDAALTRALSLHLDGRFADIASWGGAPTRTRWARPAPGSRPMCTSPAASAAPSSTWSAA